MGPEVMVVIKERILVPTLKLPKVIVTAIFWCHFFRRGLWVILNRQSLEIIGLLVLIRECTRNARCVLIFDAYCLFCKVCTNGMHTLFFITGSYHFHMLLTLEVDVPYAVIPYSLYHYNTMLSRMQPPEWWFECDDVVCGGVPLPSFSSTMDIMIVLAQWIKLCQFTEKYSYQQ